MLTYKRVIPFIAALFVAGGLVSALCSATDPQPAPSPATSMTPAVTLCETSTDGKWTVTVTKERSEDTKPGDKLCYRIKNTSASLACSIDSESYGDLSDPGGVEFNLYQMNTAKCYWSSECRYLLIEEADWRGCGGLHLISLMGPRPARILIPVDLLVQLTKEDWNKQVISLMDVNASRGWSGDTVFEVQVSGHVTPMKAGDPDLKAYAFKLKIAQNNTIKVVSMRKCVVN